MGDSRSGQSFLKGEECGQPYGCFPLTGNMGKDLTVGKSTSWRTWDISLYFIAGTIQTQSYNYNLNTHKQAIIPLLDCYNEFHVYKLEWDPQEIRIYVDSQLYSTFQNEGTGFKVWPFDKRFHLILNVAIGGTFGGANGIDDSIFPRSMVIDYVRVYQKN